MIFDEATEAYLQRLLDEMPLPDPELAALVRRAFARVGTTSTTETSAAA